ncbi:acyl carrier protein [Aerococcaceae bacterium WGS1372]
MEEYIMFEKIKEIIVDQLGVEESEVTLETSFENDLEADSLDIFQVINEIEDEFDITIDTDQDLKTVADLVSYVEGLDK